MLDTAVSLCHKMKQPMTRAEAAREVWRLTQEGHSLREAAKRISASGYKLSANTAGRMLKALKEAPPAPASPPAVVVEPVVVAAHNNSQKPIVCPYPGLSVPQGIALRSIMEGSSYKDAAKAAGVHISQLHRWRHQPRFVAFQDALAEEQARAWTEHRERIDALRNRALDVVARLLDDEDPSVNVGYVALSVLDRTGLPASKEVQHRETGPSRNADLAEMKSGDIRKNLRLLRGGEQ